MALFFEQDPTIGAPNGKEWVRNVESGNVYAVDRETAQNADIYEEPSAKAIASRYANQFEEGFRIGIPTGQTGDFEEELQERGVAFDESFDGEEKTHYIFMTAEDYESAENARKTLQTETTMRLTESKLRNIVREELSNLLREGRFDDMEPTWKDDLPNPNRSVPGETKKNVSSSFPSAKDGKVFAYDQENDKIQQVTPQTAEKKDRYRKPKPEELENYNESVSKLKNLIRQEIAKAGSKKKGRSPVNELSFREDKMRELLTREPKLERIRQEEGHSLKTMFDMYVLRNKEMKRQYKQASPQP